MYDIIESFEKTHKIDVAEARTILPVIMLSMSRCTTLSYSMSVYAQSFRNSSAPQHPLSFMWFA